MRQSATFATVFFVCVSCFIALLWYYRVNFFEKKRLSTTNLQLICTTLLTPGANIFLKKLTPDVVDSPVHKWIGHPSNFYLQVGRL